MWGTILFARGRCAQNMSLSLIAYGCRSSKARHEGFARGWKCTHASSRKGLHKTHKGLMQGTLNAGPSALENRTKSTSVLKPC